MPSARPARPCSARSCLPGRRPGRFASSSPTRPAARSTSSPAPWPSEVKDSLGRRHRRQPRRRRRQPRRRRRSPRPRPTARRSSWARSRRTRSTPGCTRSCRTTRSATSRRSPASRSVPNVLVMSPETASAARHRQRRRPGRLREEEPGQAQLRLGRQRQRRPPRRRDVQGAGRRVHGPHPVRRRQPGAAGAAAGQVDLNFDNLAAASANIKAGKLQGAGGDDGARARARCPTCRRSPKPAAARPGALRHRHLVRHLRARRSCRPRRRRGSTRPSSTPLASAELRARLASLYAEPMPMAPERFAAFVKGELAEVRAARQGLRRAGGMRVGRAAAC